MTWHTRNLPPKMQENISFVTEINNDCHIHLYDLDDCRTFIKEYYDSDVLNAYESLIPLSYKSDLWRYCVLYKFGGIYQDIKLRPVKNFRYSELLNTEHFVRDVPISGSGIYGAFMVCPPNHPLMTRCINKVLENVSTRYYPPHNVHNGFNGSLYISGPMVLQQMLNGNENIDMSLEFGGYHINDHSEIYNIKYCNQYILTTYPEYRQEQKTYSNEPHHTLAFDKKNIYSI